MGNIKKEFKIAVTIEIGDESHFLWGEKCRNFIQEQPERFELIEGDPVFTGILTYHNSLLEAKVYRQYISSKYEKPASIYYDELGNTPFVVACGFLDLD